MLKSRPSMRSSRAIRGGIPSWIPSILQTLGGDSSADQGGQSEKGLHYTEALHEW